MKSVKIKKSDFEDTIKVIEADRSNYGTKWEFQLPLNLKWGMLKDLKRLYSFYKKHRKQLKASYDEGRIL